MAEAEAVEALLLKTEANDETAFAIDVCVVVGLMVPTPVPNGKSRDEEVDAFVITGLSGRAVVVVVAIKGSLAFRKDDNNAAGDDSDGKGGFP